MSARASSRASGRSRTTPCSASIIQSLCEITLLAEKAGIPRNVFLASINDSVLGSMYTRYKTPALVNLDFTTTFTPKLLLKDLELGMTPPRRRA